MRNWNLIEIIAAKIIAISTMVGAILLTPYNLLYTPIKTNFFKYDEPTNEDIQEQKMKERNNKIKKIFRG